MTIDTKRYKKELEGELEKLTGELRELGRINPSNPGDWEPTQPNMNVTIADENELADTIEEYEGDSAILKELETRYNEVKRALERIEEGTYGLCAVGGEPIPQKRLDANPAANTCIEHTN